MKITGRQTLLGFSFSRERKRIESNVVLLSQTDCQEDLFLKLNPTLVQGTCNVM
jgi:hypothetical protein